MKRKIFIVAMTVLSLVSCRRDALLGSADASGAIGFSPYMERVSTKAVVTDVTASNLDTFKVMSYLADTSIVYFTSEVTATKSAKGLFTTNNTYYWPTSSSLDFFAYSGDGAYDETGDGAIRNTGGVASLTYVVPDEGNEDFVVAKAENCTKASATDVYAMKAQPLTFSHALSKVNSVTLKAQQGGVGNSSNYKFIVTDVSIKGAKNKATYKFNPTEGENWGPAEGSADYSFDTSNFTAPNGYFVGNASKLLKCSDTTDRFIILPQTASFSITYAVQYSPDGTSDWTEVMDTTTKTVAVPMEMGKAYDISFALTINTLPVTFIVSSVDSWTTEQIPLEYWEGGTNYGPGVLVNGLTWAPVNCGIGANYKYPYGLLYQYGRSDGQPRDGDEGADEIVIVSGQTDSPKAKEFYQGIKISTSDTAWYSGPQFTEWPMTSPSNGIGNPCPDGWRIPTIDEWGRMIFSDYDYYLEKRGIRYGNGWPRDGFIGDDGFYFGDLYFPYVSCRNPCGQMSEWNDGFYHSTSFGGPKPTAICIPLLVFEYHNLRCGINGYFEAAGCSVRCVHD